MKCCLDSDLFETTANKPLEHRHKTGNHDNAGNLNKSCEAPPSPKPCDATILYYKDISAKLSHTHYYTRSHTLLYSLTYTTILSHKHDYTLSYIHVKVV